MFKNYNMRGLFFSIIILSLLTTVNAFSQRLDSLKPYELNIYFLENFKDIFKIYLNDEFIKKDFYKTEESTASCRKYLSVTIYRPFNSISIKDIKNRKLFYINIPYNPKGKYLYLRRNDSHWEYELSDKFRTSE